MPDQKIDMTRALELLRETTELVERLHQGGEAVDEAHKNDRRKTARNAEISRSILYAAHLADAARLEVVNQYHRFKGEAVPEVHLPR